MSAQSESDDGAPYVCDVCEAPHQRSFDTDVGLAIHKSTVHKTRSDESHIERYQRIRGEIPDKYHDTYEELTGSGRAPTSVQAAICYIESSVSQSTVAEGFDVSEVTIREMTRELIRSGVVSLEYVQENSPHGGSKVFNGKDGMCAGQEVRNGI